MNAKKALESVERVDSVKVILEPGSAEVIGDADSEQLILAVKNAGYDAVLS
jgi:copper chaperone CopZ